MSEDRATGHEHRGVVIMPDATLANGRVDMKRSFERLERFGGPHRRAPQR